MIKPFISSAGSLDSRVQTDIFQSIYLLDVQLVMSTSQVKELQHLVSHSNRDVPYFLLNIY